MPTVPPPREDDTHELGETLPAPAVEGRRPSNSPLLGAGELVASRYRIEAFVARGGMGEVYRARDLELGVTVALKTVRPEIASDPVQLRRFKQEVLLARSISHLNVCRIFDIGRDDARSLSFLTMEFLAGDTLAARIDRSGPIPEAARFDLVRQLAAGLDCAHGAGIVHRDLKSANVMLVPLEDETRVVITDFGLAVAVRRVAGLAGAHDEHPERRDDGIVGTPAYMSPEQVLGESVGPPSDLYALGVVLFEMITGRLPFEGDSPYMTARARLVQPPPKVRAFAPVDARWETAIDRLLARDPGERPSSSREVLRMLEGADTPLVAPRSVLPIERDAFVGRAAELRSIRDLLQADDGPTPGCSRLVSLVGAGGTGKTRLAIHFGTQNLRLFPGGVWFADLSEARTIDDVASAVARSLGITLDRGEPIAHVANAVRDLDACLIILDNFEQLVPHAEPTVGKWMASAPRARFLVTTRESLHLAEESVFVLEPLDPQHDGLELFELRAQAHRPGFRIDEHNRPLADAIVAQLDGLPLAIELAAARVRMLSLAQLQARLADRFQLLSGGKRGRQATLRTTLDWSWELLLPWERAAIRQASVFAGGFTLEAAETVFDLGGHQDAPMVLDVLQALVDKSWLRAHVAADAPRFSMYATVHEYAAQQLVDDAERDAARARHTAFFVALAKAAGGSARLDRADGLAAWSMLHSELGNIIAACRQALKRRDEDAAAALYFAADSVMTKWGPRSVSIELGRETLAGASSPEQRAAVLIALGSAEFLAGSLAEARAHLDEAAGIFGACGRLLQEGVARLNLGMSYHQEGRLTDAKANYDAAVRAARASNDRRIEGVALGQLGVIHLDEGRTSEARSTLEEALAIVIAVGDRRREAVVRGNLSILHREQGRLEEARREAEASVRIHQATGNRFQAAILLGNLGNLHLDEGDVTGAQAKYEAALALHQETGYRFGEGVVLTSLGHLQVLRGNYADARSLFQRALALSREVHDLRNEGHTLNSLGDLDRREGRLADARAHLLEAIGLTREIDRLAFADGHCALARLERDAGDLAAARGALGVAEGVAAELGVQPTSELARAIEEVRASL